MLPYAVPATLSPPLSRARAYWQGLKRNDAPMPFWDDFAPDDLGDLKDDAFTLEVFDKPERFRFGIVGDGLKRCGMHELEGRFLGEVELTEVCGFLLSQASATVEAAEPSLYRPARDKNFTRLLLPMWGDGRISLLLGVVGWS